VAGGALAPRPLSGAGAAAARLIGDPGGSAGEPRTARAAGAQQGPAAPPNSARCPTNPPPWCRARGDELGILVW